MALNLTSIALQQNRYTQLPIPFKHKPAADKFTIFLFERVVPITQQKLDTTLRHSDLRHTRLFTKVEPTDSF